MPNTPPLLVCAPHARAAEHEARHDLRLPRAAYRVVVAGANLCGYRDQPIHYVHIPGCPLPERLSEDLFEGLATGRLRTATPDDIDVIRSAYTKTAPSS